MSVDAIDRALAEWDERLRRIDENLLALEAEPTYQMLSGVSLDGETKRVVEPALEALRDVFEQRGKLTSVLDRAKDLRAEMSGLAFWGNEEKARQIEALLAGPSIELERQSTPLAGRTLLGGDGREIRATPADLLAAMAAAYERARDAVVRVRQAWDAVEPALADVGQRIADVRRTAASLGVEAGLHDELGALGRDLEAAQARVAIDPLGASASAIGRLVPRVANIAAHVGELAAVRDRVQGGLSRARGRLDEVRATRARAEEAAQQMPREVDGASAPGTPTDAALVEGLAPWIEKIEAAAAGGRWHAAEVGLGKWNEAASRYVEADAKISGALETVQSRREELAGRLSARRAQAAALTARGVALGAGAEDVAREAEALLNARPTQLARAKALVEQYEAMVRR
jgi:hypothetical protein